MDEGVKVPGKEELPRPEDHRASEKGGRRSFRLAWVALAFLLVAGLTAGWWWESAHRAPPQIITLPNGERYQFAGVTYGTNNVPPYLPARLVRWLPKRLSDMVRKFFGPSISQFNAGQPFDGPRLFVWFRCLETNPPAVINLSFAVSARLADESGVEAGVTSYPVFANGVAWSFAEFPVFPRRSRTLRLNLYPYVGNVSSFAPTAAVTFRNPMYGRFPQWQPEAIPTSKLAGDLTVRLDDLVNGRPGVPTVRGENPETGFAMSCLAAKADETWVLHSGGLSDATGNLIPIPGGRVWDSYVRPRPPGQTAYNEFIQGALWPDEAAWLLKLELKRTSGFAPEELATFKNVPIPAIGTTNFPRLTNVVGGIPVVLTEFVRKTDATSNPMGFFGMTSEVRVELPGKPAGAALDFWSMSADAGTAVQYGSSYPPFAYVVLLRSIPTNAHTMDFTWVVQKTRSVEFLVKPPKPN